MFCSPHICNRSNWLFFRSQLRHSLHENSSNLQNGRKRTSDWHQRIVIDISWLQATSTSRYLHYKPLHVKAEQNYSLSILVQILKKEGISAPLLTIKKEETANIWNNTGLDITDASLQQPICQHKRLLPLARWGTDSLWPSNNCSSR